MLWGCGWGKRWGGAPVVGVLLGLLCGLISARADGNFAATIARPLHYQPDGTDFVVTNGREFFNRPLYGFNSQFRIDAGDRPEFSLYMPGRGGNLRLGVKTGAGAKWLFDAQKVTTRYRPGAMLYAIQDPLLGSGTLSVTALPMSGTQGLVLRVMLNSVKYSLNTPVTLLWAYGGASGVRGARDGDIGTEKVPMSQYFQLQAASASGNSFDIQGSDFTLHSAVATVVGLMPPGATLAVADANQWNSLGDLFGSAAPAAALPVVVGQTALTPGQPVFLGLQRVATAGGAGSADLPTYQAVTQLSRPKKAGVVLAPAFKASDLPRVFAEAEKHRQAVAGRVVVDTPDPYINAAAAAICVAADAVWDQNQGAFMHGAVAWRTALLGWRGGYSGDEMGQHDRTRRHLMNWFPRQNKGPLPAVVSEPMRVTPDASVRFARNEPALHSNGDLSASHYDMNLPAIDVLFRHILWTGDVAFARQQWPTIVRHLAWERRLFRRPFGADGLPLYEAYCCIWASDDLQYEGGGAAHSSAYNYYHNKMAARVARLIGQDPAPYEREAALIHKAMERELWLPDRGWYGEWKDLLGLQLVHPNAALWTFYHTVDSEVPTPMEAWQLSRFVDTQIPHIPLIGPGVPSGCFTLPTTSWMPYTWSTNNVVMAEAAHTSLAYWQAGRSDMAYRLYKGALLDSMYLGLCPGNVGMCTYYDVARRESQRDFADGVGTSSRALVEGLFGVTPDALGGVLRIRPGFPAAWDHASISHPDFRFSFRRAGLTETYTVEPKFARPMSLRLDLPAMRDTVAGVTVNGKQASWQPVVEAVGEPRIEILAGAGPRQSVVITWKGAPPATATAPAIAARGTKFGAQFGAAKVVQVFDPQKALSGLVVGSSSFGAVAAGTLGQRTVFARLRQGSLTWWAPVAFEIRPTYEIVESNEQDAEHLRFTLRNNTGQTIDSQITVRIGAVVQTVALKAPAFGTTSEIALSGTGLLPGSNRVVMSLGGKTVTGIVTNWMLKAADGAGTHWDPVNIAPVFNDRVTQIFQNQYLTPRSPYTSLAIPTQGIGSWIHWNPATDKLAAASVDDTGLRALSDRNGGRIVLPEGVPFQTPGAGDAKNIAFASQWDNYPHEVSVPLTGIASHVYLLMAGSTNSMQSRFDNGEVVVTYADGTTQTLALENPTNWWPIDQDYLIDDYAFRRPGPIPPRINLQTGVVRVLDPQAFAGKGGKLPGGAATALDLPLNSAKPLKSLTVRARANEVVIGLMAATLVRDGTRSASH